MMIHALAGQSTTSGNDRNLSESQNPPSCSQRQLHHECADCTCAVAL